MSLSNELDNDLSILLKKYLNEMSPLSTMPDIFDALLNKTVTITCAIILSVTRDPNRIKEGIAMAAQDFETACIKRSKTIIAQLEEFKNER